MLSLWNPLIPERSKSDSRMSTKNYFDRLFEDTFETMVKDLFHASYLPTGNYEKTEDGSLAVSIDVPGIKEEDITVEIDGSIVNVRGETKTTNSHRRISQSFTIPEGYASDNVKAELSNGVLRLTMASKQLPDKEVKKIPITSTG